MIATKNRPKTKKGSLPNFFWYSLEVRLILIILVCALLPLILVIIYFSTNQHNNLRHNVQDELQRIAQLQVLEIEGSIKDLREDVMVLADVPDLRVIDAVNSQNYLQQLVKTWTQYDAFFVADSNGMMIANTDGELVNVAAEFFFQECIAGNFTISDPYMSKKAGSVVVTACAPILSETEKQITGVACITALVSNLSPVLEGMQTGNTGEVYLLNREGYFITPVRYPDQLKQEGLIEDQLELELEAQSFGAQQALQGQRGVGEYANYHGVKVFGAYESVPSTGWAVLVEQETNEVFQEINRQDLLMYVLIILIAAIEVVVAMLLLRRISGGMVSITRVAQRLAVGDIDVQVPVKHHINEIRDMMLALKQIVDYFQGIIEAARHLAQGDLTINVSPRSENDTISIAFNQMFDTLHHQMNDLVHSVNELDTASVELANSAEQANQVTSQITTTIQQVATGNQQQVNDITKTAAAIEHVTHAVGGIEVGAKQQADAVDKATLISTQIVEMLRKVAENAMGVQAEAATASDVANQGTRTVEDTISSMQAIKGKVDLSSQKVLEMGNRSVRIGNITETINEITSQTNLLALNAAIEAARAGVHGKGFAVVASEVRKLAVRTSEAAQEIGDIVKDIQGSVAEATAAMNESYTEVEGGVKLANQSGEVLLKILESTNGVHQRAGKTVAASQNMVTAADELIAAMDVVSAVVEENTAATSEMTSRTQEVSQSIENIASVSQQNSAATQEVSAAAEEMNAMTGEVTASAHLLANMASGLRGIVTRFTLKDENLAGKNQEPSHDPVNGE